MSPSGPWSQPGFAAVLALVEERAGLVAPSCAAAAEEGILRAMARAGLEDLGAYRVKLAEDPAALDDLLIELTIGETYFFRTPEHFEHLRRVVLPELRERLGPGHTARLWSAACSSGEEPYSLAALLMGEGWSEHMMVYATDVSRGALARARKAVYGEWSLRGPWADRMRHHLRAQERNKYTLSAEVQRHVRFSYLNLALDTWPSPDSGIWKLDVIFCRNVLIYFNAATIQAVARRLHDALADGGYLFTGPSDPPLCSLAPLEPVLTEWGVLYRRPLPADAHLFPPVAEPVARAPMEFLAGGGAPVARTATPVEVRGLGSTGARTATPVEMPATRSPGLRTTTPAESRGLGTSGSRTATPVEMRGAGTPGARTATPTEMRGAGTPGARTAAPTETPGPRSPGARTATPTEVPGPRSPGARSATPREVPAVAPWRADPALLDAARVALARGDWREAASRIGALDADPNIAASGVRALANLDAQAAVYASAEAASRHPLVAGLRYLEALLLMGQGRLPDAERAARQALYLEPHLVVAWLILGRVLRRQGDMAGALRALREAESLCDTLHPNSPVPLADGEPASALVEVARAERRRLEAALSRGEGET